MVAVLMGTLSEDAAADEMATIDETFTLADGGSKRIADLRVSANLDETGAGSFRVVRSVEEPPPEDAPSFRFSAMGSGVARWGSLVLTVEEIRGEAEPTARIRVTSMADETAGVELAERWNLEAHQVAELPDGSRIFVQSMTIFEATIGFRAVGTDAGTPDRSLTLKEGGFVRVGPFVFRLESIDVKSWKLGLRVLPTLQTAMVEVTYGETVELPVDRSARGPDGALFTVTRGHVWMSDMTAHVEVRRGGQVENARLSFLPADEPVEHRWSASVRLGYTYVLKPRHHLPREAGEAPAVSLVIERPGCDPVELGVPVTLKENEPVEAPGGLLITWTATGHVHFADGGGAVTYVLELWHEGETRSADFEEEGGTSWKGYTLDTRMVGGGGVALTVRRDG